MPVVAEGVGAADVVVEVVAEGPADQGADDAEEVEVSWEKSQ